MRGVSVEKVLNPGNSAGPPPPSAGWFTRKLKQQLAPARQVGRVEIEFLEEATNVRSLPSLKAEA
jgi:hypothetical protein